MSVEDLVSSAVHKAFSGIRNWNPGQEPELRRFLESVLNSDIHHLVTSQEHRNLERESELQLELPDLQSRSPEVLLLEREEACSEGLVASLMAEFQRDHAVTVVLASYDRQSRGFRAIHPLRVAEESGLSIREIRNAVKRLRRKARGFRSS